MVVNEALRKGIDDVTNTCASRQYCTESRNLGLKKGILGDNISELVSVLEEEGKN